MAFRYGCSRVARLMVAVAAVLALVDESLPPTVHLQTPDPTFGLDFIMDAARSARVEATAAPPQTTNPRPAS